MKWRQIIAAFLTIVLSRGFARAPGEDIRKAVSHVRPNARVEVESLNGTRIQGRITGTSDVGFNLRSDAGGDQTFRFDEVKRVRTVSRTHPLAWVAVGVIAAVIVIAVVVFAAERHNEGG